MIVFMVLVGCGEGGDSDDGDLERRLRALEQLAQAQDEALVSADEDVAALQAEVETLKTQLQEVSGGGGGGGYHWVDAAGERVTKGEDLVVFDDQGVMWTIHPETGGGRGEQSTVLF